MRLLSRIHLCVALSGLALCVTPSQAIPITLTFIGTINDGYDYRGEFGAAHTSLSGLSVVSTYTFDSGAFGNSSYSNSGHHTITINGATRQYDFSPNQLQTYSYASRNLTENGQYNWYDDYYYFWDYWYQNYDQIYQSVDGYLSGGGYLSSYNSVYNYYNPLNIPYDATQPWSLTVQGDDSSYLGFYRYDENGNYLAYYNGTVNSVTLDGGASFARQFLPVGNNVPEPATLGLALVALLGGAIARRKVSAGRLAR